MGFRLLCASVVIAALLSGCARGVGADRPETLDGFVAQLEKAGAVRIGVTGSVGDERAKVMLEVAQPRSTVSAGCFESAPRALRTVKFGDARGGFLEASEVELGNARIGKRKLGALRAALSEGEECILTLGSDVLMPYALTIDPTRRTLRISLSQSRARWTELASSSDAAAQTRELHLLELVRDPASDWPLLAVRARQGDAQLTGTFILSTSLSDSFVNPAAAQRAGLQLGPELLRDLGFPGDVELPKSLGGDLYTLERIELSPGFGLRFAGLRVEDEWSNPGAIGLLGGDVWGRFVTTVDVAAGVLALQRPRVFVSGERQRCVAGTPGQFTEEACFVLEQSKGPSGLELVTTVWRDLPRGARVYFDVVDEQGGVVGGMCRVGLTFARSDRGVTAAHTLPWAGLEKSVPGCASELIRASEVRFALWEEGGMPECPGTCAFVLDNMTARVSCECTTSTVGVMSDAEQDFMELYRDLMERRDRQRSPGRSPPADEPADPP